MCNVFELSVHDCGGDRVVLRFFFCLVLFSTPEYNARRKSHQTIIYGAQYPAGLPELPLAKQE